MDSLILATSNAGKIQELSALLAPIHCIPQAQLGIEPTEENQLSFVENALLKARHASKLSQQPALADDSGLVVPALNGEPGIFSARYAGVNARDEDNIAQLLKNLKAIPDTQWQAYFYCVIVIMQHPQDPTPIIASGRIDGMITTQSKGSNGFGYDPIFYLPALQCTMAEVSTATKNTISHRAIALHELKKQQLG